MRRGNCTALRVAGEPVGLRFKLRRGWYGFPHLVSSMTPPLHIRRIAFTSIYLMSGGGLVAKASSQSLRQAVVIPDRPTCRACSIRLLPHVHIATQDGPGAVASPRGVARDSRGRLYLTSATLRGEIKVYNAQGEYVRDLTSSGSGPGEARGVPRVVITADDSIRVFDHVNGRYSVFAPDFSLARDTVFLFPNNGIAALDRSTLLVSSPQRERETWHLFRLIGISVEPVRKLGSPIEPVSSTEQYLLWRRIAPASDGDIWAARSHAVYQIELWSRTGDLKRRLTRTASWFTPGGPQSVREWRPGKTAPPAGIIAVREDDAGHLWVLAAVAKEDWKRAYELIRITLRDSCCSIP
jgi:hypothetical protein